MTMTAVNDTPYPLGAVPDVPDYRDFKLSSLQPRRLDLPVSIDYEKRMTPIKDQLFRGACVAFACVAVKEYQEVKERRHYLKPDKLDLSEEWVYSKIMLPGGGAYIRDGMKVLQQAGVPKEKNVPYLVNLRDTDPVWQPKPNMVRRLNHYASNYRADLYARIRTTNEMRQTLVENGPFVIGIDWLWNWFDPDKIAPDGYPLLTGGNDIAGGHAIAIVGYDDEQRVFKLRNSWGLSWGKAGYAYLSYDALANNYFDAWTTTDLYKVNRERLAEAVKIQEMLSDV